MSTVKVKATGNETIYRVDSRFVFADVVRERLRLHGMTKAELGRRTGLNTQTLANLLKGDGYCGWDKMLAICAALYIDPVKLMEGQYSLLATRKKLDQVNTLTGGFQ